MGRGEEGGEGGEGRGGRGGRGGERREGREACTDKVQGIGQWAASDMMLTIAMATQY